MFYKSITALVAMLILDGLSTTTALAPRNAENALQHPFSSSSNNAMQAHGRFLHLTDIHMDHHYEFMATIKSRCHKQPRKHWKKKMRKGKLAGYWGAPTRDCDAAPRLVYHAIDHISKEWKDKIDFVVWTGDSARHDLDHKIPRTKKEIYGLNQELTNRMRDSFRLDNNQTVPIVPVIGNNDIHPHNVLQPTSNDEVNDVLERYSEMWSDFIPLDQQDVFRKGGYFAVDVAAGIRVLSLNTLYFFTSNDAVDGCDKDGAGRTHFQWIKDQLDRARRDRARVYMIGHVPPSSRAFYPSCLELYVNLSLEYQDVIAGHMYGHLNFDHFLVLRKGKDEDTNDDDGDEEEQHIHLKEDGQVHITKDVERYVAKLRRQYKKASKKDSVVVHIAPPILPMFNPTFRVNYYETDLSSPKFGTWTSYTQYYTDLAYWNQLALDEPADEKPVPQFKIEYSTDTAYNMSDLSRESWLELAHRMTRSSEKSRALWDTYVKNVFVQTDQDI